MKPVIRATGVSKAFAGVQALSQVSFDLYPGEVHALMGENGAGKSTLMKILAGIYQRDAGDVWVNEQLVNLAGPKAAQDVGIGIVHQELNLMSHLSAAQNIFIGREPRRGWFIDEDRANEQAADLFKRVNLVLDPRARVGDLTVAKQQMVEIVKALSFNSKVLIMDEPTAALNNQEVDDLFRVIGQLKQSGVAIVYISHKMDELRRIADRVTVMRDGRYIDTVPMATTSVDTIIAMMVGRELEAAEGPHCETATPEVALRVVGLNRGKLLRNISFELRRGEILGFAGLMGAGRTEVARAIFGADRLDSGEIFVGGRRAEISSPRQAVAHRIGYLSEDRKHFGLATGLDVATNIAMSSFKDFLRLGLYLDGAAIQRTAQGFIKQLGIKTPSARQQVRLLSGGNQQKVVIAKWLLRDCDILFFDEPTRGIDVGAKAEIYKLLNALAAQGKAIVVISSELPEVLRLSHRVLVMCEGRITGELSAEQATQEKIMHLATRKEAAPAH